MSAPNPKQKYGDAKIAIQTVPPIAFAYLGLALQDGAYKYGPFNWRQNPVEAMTYIGACLRHLMAWVDGEEVASDSKMPHLAHAMACLAILADAKECETLIDNRPPSGPFANVLEAWRKECS